MNQKIIGSVDELPFNTPDPEIIWQTSEEGHIKGWVDVIGFRNLSRSNGIFYTYGPVTDTAIYEGASVGDHPGIRDELTNSFSFSQSGDQLTVSMTVILRWHTIYCDDKGCFINGRFTDTAVFQDTETIPQQFVMPGNQSVLLKHYTGEPYHPNVLVFAVSPAVTEIHAHTPTASMTHYLQIGVVNYTAKNVPFMELGKIDKWEYMGTNNTISSYINEMVSDDNFTEVTFTTAYGEIGADITEQTMEPTHVHWGVVGLIFVAAVLLYGIYRMWVKAVS